MIYSTDEIKRRITPVAEKYRLRSVYLFGSYARNKATDSSDIDVLIDTSGSIVEGWIIGGLYNVLCVSLEKNADLVTLNALTQDGENGEAPWFAENVMREKVLLYERD